MKGIYCTSTNPKYLEAVKEAKEFKRGVYQHFKGKFYLVDDVVIHLETLELVVVYHPLADLHITWDCPLKMFNEKVNGVPRFEFKLSIDDMKTLAGKEKLTPPQK